MHIKQLVAGAQAPPITLEVNSDADPENSSIDGYVANETIAPAGNGVSWADIRDSAQIQGAVSDTDQLILNINGHVDTDKWQGLLRPIMLYDASAILGRNIIAATLTVKGKSKSDGLSIAPDINVYECAPASDIDLVGADTDTFLATPLSTAISYGDFDVDGSLPTAENDFVFNSDGIALIRAALASDGIIKIGLRNANYDAANVEPTWSDNESRFEIHSADKGGEYISKLVITYF